MIKKQQPLLLLVFFFPIITSQVNYRACNQTCGSAKPFSYPFGFSSGCQIRLNCTADGEIFIGEFPVQSVTTESIIVNIKGQCNRPIDTFHQLFSHKYAPTSGNVILLKNCTETMSQCSITETLVESHFDSDGCNGDRSGNLSCYVENSTKGFMSDRKLERLGCEYFMSSISTEDLRNNSGTAVSLEVATIELGWWLKGSCECSGDANCTQIVSPVDGKVGFRCLCKQGFVGDGFLAGIGCRKVSSTCNPSKYLLGKCGGTARFLVLIGAFVFGASLMITVGSLCFLFRRRTKLRVTKSTKRRITEATGNYSVPIYPYKDIEKATNSFSEKQQLGNGAYGTVYAGKLYNDEWVAIKRIKHRDTDSIEQVMNEIKLLSSVSHTNLVRLLGCSIEYGEQILVFEFMPNGTLSQHLQRERGNGLPWPVRLTIAAETAQAIAHLHSTINPPIYHRDIKSSNILLDYNFRSKVADFGLSRLGMTETSHISTAPQGTPGYVDPQYHQDFQLSDKSDVYSFGVVLVEIITGMKVVDFSRPHNEVNLASLAADRIGKGLLDEIIDPFLEPEVSNDAWTFSSVHKISELAFRCLAFHRDMRPSMTEIATELEHLRLSNWSSFGDNNVTTSTELSSCSTSSYQSEKPLKMIMEKKVEPEVKANKAYLRIQTGPVALKSLERNNSASPVSMQDPEIWLSEQSSPSSYSFPSKSFN
ncbi:PREDICTED: wall-associated receptor kinase-like 14 isoform X2 [Lupinus angustifolius]|uniref:wall-associated receptor kinase-like 14 isoform X2 n=1 Tax=Lupinus angustifolius TaxID=3871 RepID=UPI00092F71D8|nr:PREDICTED: wall-associated receptor kinase-like 14 isoform X2 [Lupinus angustifolius]